MFAPPVCTCARMVVFFGCRLRPSPRGGNVLLRTCLSLAEPRSYSVYCTRPEPFRHIGGARELVAAGRAVGHVAASAVGAVQAWHIRIQAQQSWLAPSGILMPFIHERFASLASPCDIDVRNGFSRGGPPGTTGTHDGMPPHLGGQQTDNSASPTMARAPPRHQECVERVSACGDMHGQVRGQCTLTHNARPAHYNPAPDPCWRPPTT